MTFGGVVLSHQSLCATDYVLLRFYCIIVVISTGGFAAGCFSHMKKILVLVR